MTVREASYELGTAIVDLVQVFALNQVKKQRTLDSNRERRRLIARRFNNEFQIKARTAKCRIITVF
jgi:hypothetical protein